MKKKKIENKEVFSDTDLKSIILRRTLVRFFDLYRYVYGGIEKIEIPQKEFEDKITPILKKEMDSFLNNELLRYSRSNRSDYLSDIRKARFENSNSSLYKLLKWDKTWLSIDWVISKILKAQDLKDFHFLKSLGDAISKQPGSCAKPSTEKDLVQDLKILFDLVGIEKENRDLIKDLHKNLFQSGTISDKKADIDNFIRWLIRHRII